MSKRQRADMLAYERLATAVRRGDLTTDEARARLANDSPRDILRALDQLTAVDVP